MWEIATVVKHMLLPPIGALWIILLGVLLMRRRPGVARGLCLSGLLIIYALATPLLSVWLLRSVELPREAANLKEAQAIVVLGAGRGLVKDDSGAVIGGFASASSLQRARLGAELARAHALPVLIASGSPDGIAPSEAEVMRDSMQRDFNVAPRWIEARSRNTAENARFTAQALAPAKISTVMLVTHGYHMRRAKRLFEEAGLKVIAAPVQPMTGPFGFYWRGLIPNVGALNDSYLAMNEWTGLLAVTLRAI
jgi:uncharacterized SAM-binding protein YcdF (DUF218 family)